MNLVKIVGSHDGLVVRCQGNIDYSLFSDDLNIQPRGYFDAIYGNMILVKGNLFLCYVLIFTFVGIYCLQWKHGYFLFMEYEYFDACQALKEGIWLRKFLREPKVVERCIITCYFVII